MNVPDDYQVLSILPSGFAVDGQGGLRTAIGMPGNRLDASAYVLYTHKTHAQAVVQAVNNAGIEVTHLAYEPVAAAEAVLTEDERDLGCLLVDLGFGSTEWVVYSDGSKMRELGVECLHAAVGSSMGAWRRWPMRFSTQGLSTI
jgi:cell division protein FtsA